MSDLTDVFTDIADAIRGKYGPYVTDRYKPIEMAQAITDIPSGDGWEEAFVAGAGSRTLLRVLINSDKDLRFVVVPYVGSGGGYYGGIGYDEEYNVYLVSNSATNSSNNLFLLNNIDELDGIDNFSPAPLRIRKVYQYSAALVECKLIFAKGSSSSNITFYYGFCEEGSTGIELNLDSSFPGFSFVPRDVAGIQNPNFPDEALFIVVGDGGNIIAGDNIGQGHWASRTSGVTTALNAIAYSPSLGMFVTVGTGGVILTSSDRGASWVSRTSGVSATLRDITWSDTYSKFFAVGDSSTILTSSDGITWTKITQVTSNQSFYSVGCYDSVVLVGALATKFFWSTDGADFRNTKQLLSSYSYAVYTITPKV